jgi:hypothetical protein
MLLIVYINLGKSVLTLTEPNIIVVALAFRGLNRVFTSPLQCAIETFIVYIALDSSIDKDLTPYILLSTAVMW